MESVHRKGEYRMPRLWMNVSGEGRTAAHALLHTVLAEEFDLCAPRFDVLPGGKPVLKGSAIHFNLSHSGPFALLGVGDAPLGVDVERIRPRRPSLPRYALSDAEFSWFTGRGSRWEDFYTLWTLKESRVKCTGQGLNCAPRTIAVPLLSPGGWGALDGLWFRVWGGPDWRATCCCGEPPPKSILFHSLPTTDHMIKEQL